MKKSKDFVKKRRSAFPTAAKIYLSKTNFLGLWALETGQITEILHAQRIVF